MKWFVVATLLFGLANSFPTNDKIIDLITRHGHTVDFTSVTTKDGYILELIKISSKSLEQVKRPVLLMHGMMSSAEDFVYGGSQALAVYLASKGHDVYLGSARGSRYGQRHTTLDPNKDEAFWRFSWEDVASKDLPALIDKALEKSGQDKIRFVGHMEGATAFYVMAAQMPEYNNKIERMVALGPVAYMKTSTHPILKKIIEGFSSKAWIMKNLGVSSFKPSRELMEETKTKCEAMQEMKEMCENNYFLYKGYNSQNLNQTTLREALPRVPVGGSVREVLHLAQLMETGRFQEFNTGENRPAEFDLSMVKIPVAILYTRDDLFSKVEDVELLIGKLGNVFRHEIVNDLTNNLELLYANDIDKKLYMTLYEILDQKVSDKM